MAQFETTAQEIPDDSTILKLIYKKYDKEGEGDTYTKTLKGNEGRKYATYRIIFKDIVKLKSKTILLVLTRAYMAINLSGPLGYREQYSLKRISGKWVLDYHPNYAQKELEYISSPSIGPTFDVVAIGKDKMALVEHFYKFKDQQYYDVIGIVSEITETGLKELLKFSLGYARGGLSEESCAGEYMESTYQVIPSNQEFFEIKVIEKYYHRDKECEEVIDYKTKIMWSYQDSLYVKKDVLEKSPSKSK